MKSEIYKERIDIDEILKKSAALNDEEKNYFRVLYDSVIKRQDEYFDHIKKYTLDSMNAINQNKVYSLLITEKDILPGNNFYPMLDNSEKPDNLIFIDCTYDEAKEIEKSSENKKIKLTRYYGFINKERILSSLFRMYNISLPFFYSPFSRRAFLVEEFDDEKQCYKDVDFKREHIDIDIENWMTGELYWNIRITEDSKLRVKVVVNNTIEFIRYENCDENSYIIPAYMNDSLDFPVFYKETNDNYIDINKHEKEDYGIAFLKVEILENNIDREKQFPNIFANDFMPVKRIITKADIVFAVNNYYAVPEEYKGMNGGQTNFDTIKDYERDDRYTYDDFMDVAWKNKNYCYLMFSDSGKDKFFTDRVNCFISFMRYWYPNYYWVGVRT